MQISDKIALTAEQQKSDFYWLYFIGFLELYSWNSLKVNLLELYFLLYFHIIDPWSPKQDIFRPQLGARTQVKTLVLTEFIDNPLQNCH